MVDEGLTRRQRAKIWFTDYWKGGNTKEVKEEVMEELAEDLEEETVDSEELTNAVDRRMKYNRWRNRAAAPLVIVALGALGELGYGGYLLVKGVRQTIHDEVFLPRERIARLDSLSEEMRYINADSALAELQRALRSSEDSSYEVSTIQLSTVIDTLDTRLRRTKGYLDKRNRNIAHRDSLLVANGFGSYEEVFEALKAKPTSTVVQGYSQKTLNTKVKEAETQGRATGYAQGLHEGKAATLEQAFSLISESVREYDYTRMERQSSINYSVSQKPISTAQSPNFLTINVLQAGVDRERKVSAYTGELMGFGVKMEHTEGFVYGTIKGIKLTKDPVTRRIMSVTVEDLEGNVTSYRAREE